MRNNYPGNCFVCGKAVAKGEGWFQKNYVRKRPAETPNKRGSGVPTPTIPGKGKWLLRCTSCKDKGNIPNQHLLTP